MDRGRDTSFPARFFTVITIGDPCVGHVDSPDTADPFVVLLT